jgi:hypothetical protein
VRSVKASINIRAPQDRVWAILSDLASYPAWSPFVVAVEGRAAVGETVTLVVAMTKGRPPLRQRETISRWEEGHEISWGTVMGHPRLLKAERFQRLTRVNAGETLYETADDFEGLLVPVVMALYGSRIQAGFHATAAALKERAEAG